MQASGQLSSKLAFIAIDAHNPDPYSVQFQAGIEQALPGAMAVEVNYVGTRGFREFFYETRNQPDRVTGIQPAANFASFLAFTPGDRSHYDGLQTTLRHPMAHGLQYSARYTWFKDLSYGNADLLQEAGPQDNNNVAAEWGPAPSDVRNRFVMNAVYVLPVGGLSSSKRLANKQLLQGWQVSGVFSAQSGLPVNVYNPAAGSYPNDRPDAPTTNPYLSGFKQSATHQYLLASAFPAVPKSTASGAGADKRASRIGSVNLIQRTAHGALRGFNTDGEGYARSLEEMLPLAGANVVLIGAGGTARAIALSLTERGAQVTIMNRSVSRARTLAVRLGGVAWAGELDLAELVRRAKVVVNTSTKGARGYRTDRGHSWTGGNDLGTERRKRSHQHYYEACQ